MTTRKRLARLAAAVAIAALANLPQAAQATPCKGCVDATSCSFSTCDDFCNGCPGEWFYCSYPTQECHGTAYCDCNVL